jgi:hypothetical protein
MVGMDKLEEFEKAVRRGDIDTVKALHGQHIGWEHWVDFLYQTKE